MNVTIKEKWKDLPNYEGIYTVSNTGIIKSLDHYVKCHQGKRIQFGRIRKPQLSVKGYHQITIVKNGVKLSTGIHRLVAIAFIPNPNNYEQVNHKDGNKLNNHVSNLEWCSNRQNADHATINNLRKCNYGEKHHNTKLKNEDVFNIRKLLSLGKTQTEIGKMYNVTSTAIYYIKHNKNHTKTI